jgi:hypothetical protein
MVVRKYAAVALFVCSLALPSAAGERAVPPGGRFDRAKIAKIVAQWVKQLGTATGEWWASVPKP